MREKEKKRSLTKEELEEYQNKEEEHWKLVMLQIETIEPR